MERRNLRTVGREKTGGEKSMKEDNKKDGVQRKSRRACRGHLIFSLQMRKPRSGRGK